LTTLSATSDLSFDRLSFSLSRSDMRAALAAAAEGVGSSSLLLLLLLPPSVACWC
jgi:hypothetical protein